VATSRRERMRGLLGRDELTPHEGLLIERARSVHTIGMRFPITVAFLDSGLRVLAVRRLVPGRVALPHLRARHVLECADRADLRPGDRLTIEPAGETRGPTGRGTGR
jgi:hypothetical protein